MDHQQDIYCSLIFYCWRKQCLVDLSDLPRSTSIRVASDYLQNTRLRLKFQRGGVGPALAEELLAADSCWRRLSGFS